jgi:hypothetical protein
MRYACSGMALHDCQHSHMHSCDSGWAGSSGILSQVKLKVQIQLQLTGYITHGYPAQGASRPQAGRAPLLVSAFNMFIGLGDEASSSLMLMAWHWVRFYLGASKHKPHNRLQQTATLH